MENESELNSWRTNQSVQVVILVRAEVCFNEILYAILMYKYLHVDQNNMYSNHVEDIFHIAQVVGLK